MKMNVDIMKSIEGIAEQIAANGVTADATDTFSSENYDLLAANKRVATTSRMVSVT